MNRSLPLWARRLLAVHAATIGPVALFAVLLFGGGRVATCLSLYSCPPPPRPEGPLAFVATATGARATAVVLASAWAFTLLASGWTVIRRRPRLFVGLIVGAGVSGIGLGLTTLVLQLVSGARLRVVAFTGAAVACTVAVTVAILAISMVTWRSDR